MPSWIEDEWRTVDLPDSRLNDRFRVVLARLSDKPTLSIPAACNGWAGTQAAYRFFANDQVDDQGLLKPHFEATLERIRQQSMVLIAQDTTELELTRAEERVGGPLSDEDHWGVHTHLALAVTPERLSLGLVSSYTRARDPATFRKRKQKQGKPIEQKESHRWLEGYRRASVVAATAPDTPVIALSDSFALRLGRECPEMPCDAVFAEAEWRAVDHVVVGQAATTPPSLGQMVLWIAQLGGYLNRKGDGPPGPQTMWIGLQRARDFALTWIAIKNPQRSRKKWCVTMSGFAWAWC